MIAVTRFESTSGPRYSRSSFYLRILLLTLAKYGQNDVLLVKMDFLSEKLVLLFGYFVART
jgi:hypothetical protein